MKKTSGYDFWGEHYRKSYDDQFTRKILKIIFFCILNLLSYKFKYILYYLFNLFTPYGNFHGSTIIKTYND